MSRCEATTRHVERQVSSDALANEGPRGGAREAFERGDLKVGDAVPGVTTRRVGEGGTHVVEALQHEARKRLAAVVGVGLVQQRHPLALLEAVPHLAHAVGGEEVALGEDADDQRALIDVVLELVDALEVVHVEEDLDERAEHDQLPLDERGEVLRRAQ